MNRLELTAEVVAARLEGLRGLSKLSESLLGARGIRVPREVFQRRSLGIQGRLTPRALGSVRGRLPRGQPGPRDVPLFASLAGMDFHVGREFDALLPAGAKARTAFERAILVGVIQQDGTSGDYVPRGSKTICVFRFPSGIPSLIESLPELDDGSYSVALWLGTRWDVERLEGEPGAL